MPRRNTALVEQHLLHRLWNAMAADRLMAISRHHADDQSADHGHNDHPQPKVVARRRGVFVQMRCELSVKRDVGNE